MKDKPCGILRIMLAVLSFVFMVACFLCVYFYQQVVVLGSSYRSAIACHATEVAALDYALGHRRLLRVVDRSDSTSRLPTDAAHTVDESKLPVEAYLYNSDDGAMASFWLMGDATPTPYEVACLYVRRYNLHMKRLTGSTGS